MSARILPIRRSGLLGVAIAVACATLLLAPLAPARAMSSTSTWGPVTLLWDHRPDDQSLDIVTTSDGTTYAAWKGVAGEHQYVAVRPAGGAWSSPRLVGDATYNNLTTLLPVGHRLIVIWMSPTQLNLRTVYPDATLGPVSRVATVSSPRTPCVDCQTAAGDGTGALAAVWAEDVETRAYFSYRPAGGHWTAKERVPVNGWVRGVVLDGSGTATVLVSQGGYDNYHRLLTVRRAPDGTWSAPVVLASDTAPDYLQSPEIVANAVGGVLVSWESGPKWTAVTLRARYRAPGGGFAPAHTFTNNLDYYSSRIALDASGRAVMKFQTRATGYLKVMLSGRPPGGGWSPAHLIDTIEDQWDSQLVMNDSGDFVVAVKSFNAGVHLIRCPQIGACDPAERHLSVGPYDPQVGYGPQGSIALFWGRGCKGDVCQSQRLMTQVSS